MIRSTVRRLPRKLRTAVRLTHHTVKDSLDDRVLGLAAEAGFWAMLSLPPLLLGLLGVVGYLGELADPAVVERIQASVLALAGEVLTPRAVDNLVEPLVSRVLERGYASIASLGFVLSLWSGSAAMSAYVRTITIAYDMRDLRSAWKGRLLAFGLYLGALGVGAVLLPVLVLGPDLLIELAPTGSLTRATSALLQLAYWPTVALGSVMALASLYHLSVPVRTPWHRDVPGAVLAMALWVTGSYGLRAYLESTSKYGALSASIGVLLFFYVTALAVLIGAELNAEIDKMWPTAATAEARARSGSSETGPPR